MSMTNLPSLLQEAPLISDFPNQATQSGLLHFQSERATKGPLATSLHLQDKLRVILVANEEGKESLEGLCCAKRPMHVAYLGVGSRDNA